MCLPRKRSRQVRKVACLVALLLCHGAARPQRVLVATVARATTQEPTRAVVHSVDMALRKVLPGSVILPGTTLTGPMAMAPDGSAIAISSGYPLIGENPNVPGKPSYATVLSTAPFRAVPGGRIVSPVTCRVSAALFAFTPAPGNAALVLYGVAADDDGAMRGYVKAYKLTDGRFESAAYIETALQDPPVAALAMPGRSLIALLCRKTDPQGGLLRVRDVITGNLVAEIELPPPDAAHLAAEPAAMALGHDGALLFVLMAGCEAESSGEPASWLAVFDTTEFRPTAPPLELPGTSCIDDEALRPVKGPACWVATRSPRSRFGYLTQLRLEAGKLAKTAQYSFSDVPDPLRVAPALAGPGLAVAVDNRLEIWPTGKSGGRPIAFDAPVRVLEWRATGLFVGEGSRLHYFSDLSAREPSATIRFQTGFVTDLAVVPTNALPAPDADADGLTDRQESRLGTAPDDADSDDDGIHDGADPEPTAPSPRVDVPDAIVFAEKAAGHNVRAVTLDPAHGTAAEWAVDFDRNLMPWLHVYPTSARLGEQPYFHVAIDPAWYFPQSVAGGELTVHVTGTTAAAQAAGSPATVAIRVAPKGDRLRRILWIWPSASQVGTLRSEADPAGLAALAELLAAPPHHFSHQEAAAPFLDPLDNFTIVVVSAEAAVRGALTSPDLLEYVARGGGLLFLGKHLPEVDAKLLTLWMSPIGANINPNELVSGTFPVRSQDPWCSHWPPLPIAGGCTVTIDAHAATLVTDGTPQNRAVFAALNYGHGRAALLAAATPLQTAAFQNQGSRRFAADLFRWLALAGTEFDDVDADGLTDNAEDPNGNGRTDPGETDYRNPDSDGDGIPDGLEDANRNGRVDEAETSPLNPDSDGDGVFDGADLSPWPAVDAPVVAIVEPPEGPAEGGTRVLISGLNLVPDSVIRFGDRIALRIKRLENGALMAYTPPHPSEQGGEVDVLVTSRSTDLSGVLRRGFRYTPRTRVQLVAEIRRAPGNQYADWDGTVRLSIVAPPGAGVGRVTLRLRTQPSGRIEWGAPVSDPNADHAARPMPGRSGALDELWLDLAAPRSTAQASEPIQLATVPWRRTPQPDPDERIRVIIDSARATALNGQSLDVATRDAVIDLDTTPPTSPEPAVRQVAD